MRRARVAGLAATAAVLALLLLALAGWAQGSVIVADRGGAVASAAIVDGSGEVRSHLHRLPFGLFIALPRGDGSVLIRRRDRSVCTTGYVTVGLHSWFNVTVGTGCTGVHESVISQ